MAHGRNGEATGREKGTRKNAIREETEEAGQAVFAHDHERIERQFQSIVAEASWGEEIGVIAQLEAVRVEPAP